MNEAFIHPITGELQDATKPNLYAALVDTDEKIGELYASIKPVREEISRLKAALRPVRIGLAEATSVRLPAARFRTPTQERVAVCPRCGEHMEGDE